MLFTTDYSIQQITRKRMGKNYNSVLKTREKNKLKEYQLFTSIYTFSHINSEERGKILAKFQMLEILESLVKSKMEGGAMVPNDVLKVLGEIGDLKRTTNEITKMQ